MMLAAARLQLHRPAVPLQHALAPSGAWSGRGRHARPLAHRAAAAAKQPQEQPDESSSENNDSGGHQQKRGRGKPSSTAARQPQLQAWLQQEQGLLVAEADQHARRLALIFGSQQAALDSLPATFEWCRRRGLTGLQTVQLLDDIANKRRENVAQFTALVQPVWQQLDSYIAAWAEQQLQAGGGRLRKHTSLAEVLCSRSDAAQALGMPPDHVEAWLTAVSQRLPAAAIGRLLLAMPEVVLGRPSTASAAVSWAIDVLGVADSAAFCARVPGLLLREVPSLQRNLDSLQQALGWTPQQARQLVMKQPKILGSSPATVLAVLAWLQQLFPDADQLVSIIDRGPMLVARSAQQLQGNADYLRQALGWQDGNDQLAAFVAAYPQPFAMVDLSSEETQDKLRLLSEVVGISTHQCLTSGIGYLCSGLATIAARYMLARERAPDMLFNRYGELHLSWITQVSQAKQRGRLGLSDQQYSAFMRQWPRSEQGRRLLEGLRSGSVEGWPRPPMPSKAQQQQWAEAQQRRQAQAARKQGAAAAMDSKRRGRGRPHKVEGSSGSVQE